MIHIEFPDKKKVRILRNLLIVAIILLMINIAIDAAQTLHLSVSMLSSKKSITLSEINENFISIMNDFSIGKNNFKSYEANDKQYNIYKEYEVYVSKDFSHVLFLNELNRNFIKYGIAIRSKEKKIRGNTDLSLFNRDEREILHINIIVCDTVKNPSATFALIINGGEKTSLDEIRKDLNTPFKFVYAVIPNERNKENLNNIKNRHLQYGIIINDDVTDYRYKLKDNINITRMKSSIFSIVSDFPELKFVLYDPDSKLANSWIFKYIKAEFDNNGFKLVSTSSLKVLERKSDNDIASMLKYIYKSSTGKENALLLSHDDYSELLPIMYKAYLSGTKFIYFSELAKYTN